MPVFLLIWGWFAAGCRYDDIRAAQLDHRAGRPEAASTELADLADSRFGGPHRILTLLELGSARHDSGRFAESSDALLRAERGFDAQDARPRTSITEELYAAASSPLSVDYRGTPTDRVMAPTIRAMNAMLLGDDESARLALNEAAIRQTQNVERRRDEIEAAQQAKGPPGVNVSRTVSRALQDSALRERLGSLDAFEPYRGFVNPFAEMLHGVYRLAAPRDSSDLDRGIGLLRSVAGTVENRFVAEALLDADAMAAGGDGGGPHVHVFFATGFCPIREETRIDLPLFLVNDAVDYAGLAFPRLAYDHYAVGWLDIETPDTLVRTELLADMDRLMASEFEAELPALLTRAVIGAGARVAASYGVNAATSDDEMVNLLARLAAGLYLYSQNRADTRAWATLPKAYHYARVPAPAGGRVMVSTPAGQTASVDVAPDGDTILFVRSTRPGAPLRVRSVRVEPSVPDDPDYPVVSPAVSPAGSDAAGVGAAGREQSAGDERSEHPGTPPEGGTPS